MSIYQKTVGNTQAIGVPGAFASINPVMSTPIGCVADEDVQVGGFVWSTDPGFVESCAPGGQTVKPLGFVARAIANAIPAYGDVSSDKINEGFNVNVQVKGDFYAVSQTDAAAGEKVFAVLSNGTLKTGVAGTPIDGAVETDWSVTLGGTAGSVIIISNY